MRQIFEKRLGAVQVLPETFVHALERAEQTNPRIFAALERLRGVVTLAGRRVSSVYSPRAPAQLFSPGPTRRLYDA